MNPEEVLNDVATRITAVAKDATGKVYVVRQGLNVAVVSSAARTVPSLKIATYNAADAREGLTIREWEILKRRLEKVCKEINQCKEQSKH